MSNAGHAERGPVEGVQEWAVVRVVLQHAVDVEVGGDQLGHARGGTGLASIERTHTAGAAVVGLAILGLLHVTLEPGQRFQGAVWERLLVSFGAFMVGFRL